jgi:type I restriction enzyme S subunit
MLENRMEVTNATDDVELFSLDAHWISQSAGLRLDAGYYNPRALQALATLRHSGLPLKRLGEVTQRIFVPPRFKRIYVDKEHGVPFLQGSHIVHFQPADLKYLSRVAHKKLEPWIIEAGWVLVTCSGTIGRVTIALQRWHGWAASQHILRIVPDSNGPCPAGYLYAYLSSPLGQAQFNGIYGAVVDELTADHVQGILIPLPQTAEQQAIVDTINSLTLEAMRTKEKALECAEQAVSDIGNLVGS